MIKVLVTAIIIGTAAVIGWFWFNPECPGGAVVADEAACRAVAGFDASFCANSFAGATAAIVRSGNTFKTLDDCRKRHNTCVDLGTVFAARPSGYCLVRAAEGRKADMFPVYRGP